MNTSVIIDIMAKDITHFQCFCDLTSVQDVEGAVPGRSGDAAGLPCSSPAAAAAVFLHGGCIPSCPDSETRHPGIS